MSRQAIDKLSEKLRQQDQQIETQAATITALQVKLGKAERAADELRRRLEIARGGK